MFTWTGLRLQLWKISASTRWAFLSPVFFGAPWHYIHFRVKLTNPGKAQYNMYIYIFSGIYRCEIPPFIRFVGAHLVPNKCFFVSTTSFWVAKRHKLRDPSTKVEPAPDCTIALVCWGSCNWQEIIFAWGEKKSNMKNPRSWERFVLWISSWWVQPPIWKILVLDRFRKDRGEKKQVETTT